jgi:hypothetical protein
MYRFSSDGLNVVEESMGGERIIAQAANPFLANLIAYRLNIAD